MIVTTTDPISGNEVDNIATAPFLIEGTGDSALKIFFESRENLEDYSKIQFLAPEPFVLDIYSATTGEAREM